MPVETAEVPIDASISTTSKPAQQISPLSVDVKRFMPQTIRDEFLPPANEVLKPKPIKIEKDEKLTDAFNKALERDFQYFSITYDLEVNTERTQIIQGVVDKLTAGEGLNTRVVIMRRGLEPRAFVMPDGTIFISQSMLNCFDSLDEVAAVLAHEVGHLINKTAITKAKSGPGSFGVSWMHEAACDLLAPQLLEKAGFKSWAFATAIEKVQGIERGVVHQSGLMRASQSIGSHLAIDRSTSSKEEVQIPTSLKGKAFKTNLELIMDKIKDRKSIQALTVIDNGIRALGQHRKQLHENYIAPLEPLLEKLHPRNFGEVYRYLNDHRSDSEQMRRDWKTANEIVKDRLLKAGFSKAEINLYLVHFLGQTAVYERDAYIFEQVSDLVEAVDTLAISDMKDIEEKMDELLFDSSSYRILKMDNLLLNLMSRSIFDVNVERVKDGLPVTRDSLLYVLQKLSKIERIWEGWERKHNMQFAAAALVRYVEKTYLIPAISRGSEVDHSQIKEFFQEVKNRGIKLDSTRLTRGIKDIYIKSDQIRYPQKGKQAKVVTFSESDRQKIIETANEIFAGERFTLTEETIDQFFNQFMEDKLDESQRKDLLENFLKSARDYLDGENVDDKKRLYFAKYIMDRFENVKLECKLPCLKLLENPRPSLREIDQLRSLSGDIIPNDDIRKFNLAIILATSFFRSDNEHFYQLLEPAMEKMDFYTNNLSRNQLINLCQGLFSAGFSSGLAYVAYFEGTGLSLLKISDVVKILDHQKFIELPMIKKIRELDKPLDFQDLKELKDYVKSELSNLFSASFTMYGDKAIDLIVGRQIRGNFERILENGLSTTDYPDLIEFLERHYPEGVQREQFLREIYKTYLNSPDVSFKKKIDYAVLYFNSLGPEVMVILADQIEDIETYRYFRMKMGNKLTSYLEAQELTAVNVAAGIDFFSSYFVNQFEKLLMTCQTDPKVGAKISTDLAYEWFKENLGGFKDLVFDPNLRKFFLSPQARLFFRTLADSFAILKGLTDLQKFVIIHKSLTDSEGALTSLVNRKILANLLTKSLGMEKGFVASVLSAACTEADAKLISIPAAMMLVPLVFKTLDIDRVDVDKLKKSKIYVDYSNQYDELGRIYDQETILLMLRSDSRSVSFFGANYVNQPDCELALLAQESDQQFTRTTNYLERILGLKEDINEEKGQTEIDPSLEAVIRGVETSGALGIRALQLAAQFETFSPQIEKRLSETFDSNPGLEKLRFWENLNKLAKDALAKGDDSIEQFLKKLKLGDYVGGGSLQTTYAALIDAGTDEERKVVVKLRNPNVDQFILESYNSAVKTLEFVANQKGAGKNKQYAQTGRVLMDLAQKWCLDDINDTTYIERDDLFRQVIEQFDQSEGKELFYAPEREFTSLKLKSETLAPGQTINKFLNDPSVNFEEKQEAVTTLIRFFIHQFKVQPFEDEEGKFNLVHSDPHVGNYLIDGKGNYPKFGVVDRSMYLKLSEQDIKVLEKLILPGNDNDFVYSFIERVLDINKVRGIQRAIITVNVLAPVYLEYRRQQVKGNINRLELMRTMFQALADSRVYSPLNAKRLDVPLSLRLMIRNIGAFQELGRRYGVKFEALYREAA